MIERSIGQSSRLARVPMERLPAANAASALARSRAGRALSRPHNWPPLAKFCPAGVSGYAVNLAVYTALLRGAGFHYLVAATCSFLVAVTSNYTRNRAWPCRGE